MQAVYRSSFDAVDTDDADERRLGDFSHFPFLFSPFFFFVLILFGFILTAFLVAFAARHFSKFSVFRCCFSLSRVARHRRRRRRCSPSSAQEIHLTRRVL